MSRHADQPHHRTLNMLILTTLLFSTITVGQCRDDSVGYKCVKQCAAPYKQRLKALAMTYEMSLRLLDLEAVCSAYNAARKCLEQQKCSIAEDKRAQTVLRATFDMDVPCSEQALPAFKQHSQCLSRSLRHEDRKCQDTCRQNNTDLASAYVMAEGLSGNAAREMRNLVEECHVGECASSCLEPAVLRHCDGNVKAATLIVHWKRQLLLQQHVQRFQTEHPDEPLPMACQWAKHKQDNSASLTGHASRRSIMPSMLLAFVVATYSSYRAII